MGRPPSGRDEYLEWQQRLESQKASGLSVPVFCLQEGVGVSTFHHWVDQLRDGIPESLVAERANREQAEKDPAMFLPVSLKASPIELQLPNGGVVRLPLSVGRAVGLVSEVMVSKFGDHRPQAIGRKNWLFLGSEAAGPRAAVLCIVLAGAKRHRIEPWSYVRELLLRVHADNPRLEEMLPDRWATAHPEDVLTHRLDESRAKATRTRARRAHRRAHSK